MIDPARRYLGRPRARRRPPHGQHLGRPPPAPHHDEVANRGPREVVGRPANSTRRWGNLSRTGSDVVLNRCQDGHAHRRPWSPSGARSEDGQVAHATPSIGEFRRPAPRTRAGATANDRNASSLRDHHIPRARVSTTVNCDRLQDRQPARAATDAGCGRRRRVRRRQNGAVVRLVAEVAAVRQPLGAVGQRLHERLVDPVPDEAALEPGVRRGSRPSTRRALRTSCPSRGCTRT